MKKLLAMLLTVIALFSLAACSDAASPKTDTPAQESAPAEPTAAPEPEETSESTYCGTWEVVSAEQNGITATVDALEKNGNSQLS